MGTLPQYTDEFSLRDRNYFMSTDFSEGVDTAKFAKGTNTAIDATVIHNPVNLNVPATNNAEEYIASAGKPLLFAANKPLSFKALVEFNEASTTDAVGQFIGMSSATVTALLADDGAGLAATQSAAGFFIEDGSSNFSVFVQNGAAGTRQVQEIAADSQYNLLAAAIPGSSTSQRLFEIEVRDNGNAAGLASDLLVVFKLNGSVVHQFCLDPTSAALMAWVVQAKAGTAAAQDYLVKHVAVAQRKAELYS